MITVNLPGGATAQFPDGTPQSVMTQAIQAKFPPANAGPSAPSPAAAPAAPPSFLGSALATVNHAVTDLPVIGPALQWTGDNLAAQTIGRMSGQDPDEWLKKAQAARTANDAANPIAAVGGGLAGNVVAAGLTGGTTVGADALGMTGGIGRQMVNSGLSTLGLTTADNMVRGQKPTDALASATGPAAVASAIPLVGGMIGKGAQAVADTASNAAQRSATNAVIGGAPAAADLKNAASQAFEAGTGGKPIQVNDTAYFRFLGGVKQVADKFRINPQNDPQASGLLDTMMRIADDTSNGTVVDMKDLHLVRQLAQKVGQSSSGRDAAFGNAVVGQMDSFIKDLKPTDVFGENPKQAVNDLMAGISGWARAKRVGAIEEAINAAQYSASGVENGLRTNFRRILTNPDTRKLYTQAEQQAIEDVVNGGSSAAALRLLGKFGFPTGGKGGNNMLGGSIGGMIGAGVGSVLGPVGGAVGSIALPAIATGARRVSEASTSAAANRAAQIAAMPGIPSLARKTVPPMLTNGLTAAQLIARGMALSPSFPGR